MPPTPHPRLSRLNYLLFAICTIAAGLALHFGGGALPPVPRDMLGDALWAMMIFGWIGVLAPDARLSIRSSAALAICVAVELSQLYRDPWLDEIRRTTIGHLVLGSGFDPRDFVAYAAGVLAAALIEIAVMRRNLGYGAAALGEAPPH